MKTSFSRVLRLGSAVLTMGVPLLITGCGGGDSSPQTQTVRGVVLLDTGTGASETDPLAGLVPLSQAEVRAVGLFDPPSFPSTPHPKTNSKGLFTLTPYRGGHVFYLNLANRCSTTPQMGVSKDGEVFATSTTIENFNGASEALILRARLAFEALQASTDADKPDVLILVSDQPDACASS